MVNMKRLIKVIITVLIALLTIGLIYNFRQTNEQVLAVATETETSNVVETTTTKTTTIKKINYVIDTKTNDKVDGIAQNRGNANEYYLNKLNKELNKVPNKLLNIFTNEGWNIYITGENIAQTYFDGKYSSVQGVTRYNEKEIVIEDRAEAVNESTIHEFGHFLDYYLGFASNSDEFKNIYNEEVNTFKSNITNSSCVRNEREFFAETFYYMYTNPSKCTPKAYEYISNLIDNL